MTDDIFADKTIEVKQVTRPYELLVRIDPRRLEPAGIQYGVATWNVSGDSWQPVSDQVLPIELMDKKLLTAIVGNMHAELLVQHASVQRDISTLAAAHEKNIDDLATQFSTERDNLTGQLDAALRLIRDMSQASQPASQQEAKQPETGNSTPLIEEALETRDK